MIWLGEVIAGEQVFVRAQFHDDTGDAADPTTPTARQEGSIAGTFVDLAVPTKRDSQTGYYGVDIDTTGYTQGLYIVRISGIVATAKSVATVYGFRVVARRAENTVNANLVEIDGDTTVDNSALLRLKGIDIRPDVSVDAGIVVDASGDASAVLLQTAEADVVVVAADGAALGDWNGITVVAVNGGHGMELVGGDTGNGFDTDILRAGSFETVIYPRVDVREVVGVTVTDIDDFKTSVEDIDLELSTNHGAGSWEDDDGDGTINWSYRVLYDSDSDGIADDPPIGLQGVTVVMTSDVAGTMQVGSTKVTDSQGYVYFTGLTAGTYYLWREKAGLEFDDPDTEVVS